MALTRRPFDVALGAAVVAVVAVAIADAVRSGDDPPRRSPATASPDLTLRAPAAALRDGGIVGTLVYADASCRLHALRLPELEPVDPPEGPDVGCRFELSPDGRRVAPQGAAWATSRVYAVCRGTSVDVQFTPMLRPQYRYDGCVPAWRPTTPPILTVVRDGDVLEVAPACAGQPPCERVLVPRTLVRAAAATHPNVSRANDRALLGVEIVDTAWLSRERLVLLLRVAIRRVGRQDVVAVVGGGRVHGSYFFFDTARDALEAVVGGTRAWGGGTFAFTAAGPRLAVPSAFGPIRAAAWSPDERWLALAARGVVAFVRPGPGAEARVVTVPLDAADVGWAPPR